MKNSLTIIELIFTIVLIGLVFTVIPRIIYISNKSLEFSSKEDAIFNLMTKMMDISVKEFDENDTQTDEILLANKSSKVLLCNKDTGYRVGGFRGGRNCLNDDLNVSDIGVDSDEPPFDDVDDYNASEENTTASGDKVYTLKIYVGYTKEWNSDYYDYSNQSFNFNFSNIEDNTKRNIKRVYIVLSRGDKNISTSSYFSANIGHAIIKSEEW